MSTRKIALAEGDGDGPKFVNKIKLIYLLRQANNLLRSRFKERWLKHCSKDWDADKASNAQQFITGCGQKLYRKLGKIQKDMVQDGNLSKWDVTLFTDIFIQVSFEGWPADKEEKRQMEQLKHVRNPVAHTDEGLSDHEFQELWTKAEPVVLYLGGSAQEITKIKNSVNVAELEGQDQDQGLNQVDADTSKEFECFKTDGNNLFRDKKFEAAIEVYTNAIALDGLSQVDRGVLYSNRSAAYLALVEQKTKERSANSTGTFSGDIAMDRAIDDAKEAMRIRPAWYKGYFRAGKAYLTSKKFEKAVRAFDWSLSLAPGNEEILQARDDARRRLGIDTRNEHLDPTRLTIVDTTEEAMIERIKKMTGRTVSKKELKKIGQLTEKLIPGQADVNKAHELRDGVNGQKKDEEAAILYYTKAATAGNPEALYNLALLYQKGRGVKQDFRMCIKLLKEAAALPAFRKSTGVVVGVAEAQHSLGLIYSEGVGVEPDHKIARTWYEKAVENNHAPSANNLAFMYRDGQGVETDMKRASQYWHLSAALGNPLAMESLSSYYSICELDPEQAEYWHNQAIENGSLNARLNKKDFDDNLAKMKKRTNKARKELTAWEAEQGLGTDGMNLDARFRRMKMGLCPELTVLTEDFEKLAKKCNARAKTPQCTMKVYDYKTLHKLSVGGSKTAERFLRAYIHFDVAMDMFVLHGLGKHNWAKFCHELAECCRHESLVIQCPQEMRVELTELVYKSLSADAPPSDIDREARICYAFLNIFNVEQSLRFEEASLKKYPEECLFYLACSNSYAFMQQWSKALNVAKKGLQLFPGDLELIYNVASVGYIMDRKEVPTKVAIEAYEEFLKLAPPDHRKVPLAYYAIGVLLYFDETKQRLGKRSQNKKKSALDLTEVNKYYRLGLEAEKEQLPYFLPYECSQKEVLENFLQMAALIPGAKLDIVPERKPPPSSSEISSISERDLTLLTSPMRVKVIREHRQFVRDYPKQVAGLDKGAFKTKAPTLKQTAPKKLAGLRSITFRDMDMFKDHVYEGCVLEVRTADDPANVPTSPSIRLVLEDENHDACRAFVYNFAGGTPDDYNFSHVLTQLGQGAKMSIINPYMRLAVDRGYGIRIDDPSTLFLHSPAEPKSCRFCGREDAKLHCSKCGSAWYCGRECQEIDWKKLHHKLICGVVKFVKA